MSVVHVVTEIDRFLASETPEILCITGRWGVGKTFSWNYYLKRSRESGAIALGAYSYVSLFGKNGIDDLRQSIFENTDTTSPSAAVGNSAGTTIASLMRRVTPFLSQLPKVGDAAKFASQFYFLAVRHQIICLDDLERVGRGLSANDVLGLASFLKEQRKCKVVLLLNHEELSGEDRATYDAQLEKVTDTVVTFEPTAKEAAEIGVNPENSFSRDLKGFVTTLGITNIRVIRKIERFALRLESILVQFDRPVFLQALHSAALFGWSFYLPTVAPPLALIRRYNQTEDFLSRNAGELDPHERWRSVLSDYGYTTTDEFDLVILRCLERGYFDDAEIKSVADLVQKQKRAASREGSFQTAWDLYHGSFDNNEQEVVDALYKSFKQSVDVITPLNASSTIQLFREVGDSPRADELVAFYVANRTGGRDAFDLENYPFAGDVRDEALIAAMKAKFDTFVDDRGAKDVLLAMGVDRGWLREDLLRLASVSSDEYYGILKSARDDELRRLVRSALQFRGTANAPSEVQLISSKVRAALQRIAGESAINARRVRGYGVRLT